MQDYSLISLVRTLHAWRKPLVFVTFGVAVISAVVSLLVPVYYRASTTFYAASQDLYKPQKVFGYTQSDMYYFGGSEDVQRLLTTGVSNQVMDYLVNEFNLYDHYGIKKDSPRASHRVHKKLLSNYKIIRTKYDALEITVEDKDSVIAARLANGAREMLNNVITGIIKGSQHDLISSYREAITAKSLTLSAIEDSLSRVQTAYGIFDPAAQSEFLSTLVTSVETSLARDRAMLKSYKENRNIKGAVDSIGHLTAKIAGLEQQRNLMTGSDSLNNSAYNFARFTEGRSRVEFYDDAYKKAINSLNIDREMLKQMEAAVALDVTAVYLIEEAAVPDVRSRPQRSLLVIAAVFAAMIFMVFGILLFESVKEQDWSFLRW